VQPDLEHRVVYRAIADFSALDRAIARSLAQLAALKAAGASVSAGHGKAAVEKESAALVSSAVKQKTALQDLTKAVGEADQKISNSQRRLAERLADVLKERGISLDEFEAQLKRIRKASDVIDFVRGTNLYSTATKSTGAGHRQSMQETIDALRALDAQHHKARDDQAEKLAALSKEQKLIAALTEHTRLLTAAESARDAVSIRRRTELARASGRSAGTVSGSADGLSDAQAHGFSQPSLISARVAKDMSAGEIARRQLITSTRELTVVADRNSVGVRSQGESYRQFGLFSLKVARGEEQIADAIEASTGAMDANTRSLNRGRGARERTIFDSRLFVDQFKEQVRVLEANNKALTGSVESDDRFTAAVEQNIRDRAKAQKQAAKDAAAAHSDAKKSVADMAKLLRTATSDAKAADREFRRSQGEATRAADKAKREADRVTREANVAANKAVREAKAADRAVVAALRSADRASASYRRRLRRTPVATLLFKDFGRNVAQEFYQGFAAVDRLEGKLARLVRGVGAVGKAAASGGGGSKVPGGYTAGDFEEPLRAAGERLNKTLLRLGKGVLSFRGLIVLAIVALGPLAAALGSLGAVALGAANALVSLAGAAFALPGLFFAAGIGVASLVTALSPLITVFKAYAANQKEINAGARQTGEAHRVAANRVRDSTLAYARASRGLIDAQFNERQSQVDLNVARQAALRSLQDIREEVARASLNEQGAVLSLKQAHAEYRRILADANATALDREEGLLRIKNAEWDLHDVRVKNQRLGEDSTLAERRGVEGSQQVVDAKKAAIDATLVLREAVARLSDATFDLAQAHREEASGGTQAYATAVALADALAKLGPNARIVALTVLGMADGWKAVRRQVGENFFRPVVAQMGSLKGLLPTIANLLNTAASALGDVTAKGIALIGSGPWKTDFATLAKSNAVLIANLGDAALFVLDAFRNLTIAAAPFTEWLTNAIREVAEGFDEWSASARRSGSLHRFLLDTEDRLTRVWRIGKNIVSVFASWYTASKDFTTWLLTGAEKATAGWAATAKAQEATGSGLQKWLRDVRPLLSAVAGFLAAIGRTFAALASDPRNLREAKDILDALATDVLPHLLGLFGSLSASHALSDIVKIIGNLFAVLDDFVSHGGALPIEAFVKGFLILTNLFLQIATATGAAPVLAAIGVALGALAAVAVVGKFTGFFKLLNGLQWLIANKGRLGAAFKDLILGKESGATQMQIAADTMVTAARLNQIAADAMLAAGRTQGGAAVVQETAAVEQGGAAVVQEAAAVEQGGAAVIQEGAAVQQEVAAAAQEVAAGRQLAAGGLAGGVGGLGGAKGLLGKAGLAGLIATAAFLSADAVAELVKSKEAREDPSTWVQTVAPWTATAEPVAQFLTKHVVRPFLPSAVADDETLWTDEAMHDSAKRGAEFWSDAFVTSLREGAITGRFVNALFPPDTVQSAIVFSLKPLRGLKEKIARIMAEIGPSIQSLGPLLAVLTDPLTTNTKNSEAFTVALKGIADSGAPAAESLRGFALMADLVAGASLSNTQRGEQFRDILDRIRDSAGTAKEKLDPLNRMFNDIAQSTLNARDKADLLKDAWAQLYQPAIDATHASDDWYVALNNVKDATDKHRYALSDHSNAAIESRRRIEDAAAAARDLWLEDVALHGVTKENTALFDKHITELEGVASGLTATKGEAHKLVDQYHKFPPKLHTKITVDPNNAIKGLQAIYDRLVNNYIAQYAFEHHVSLEESKRLFDESRANPNLLAALARAKPPVKKQSGGLVDGLSDGRVDNRHHLLTPGEFVVRKKAVDQPGAKQLLHDINEGRLDPSVLYAGLNLAVRSTTSLASRRVPAVAPQATTVTNTNTRNAGLSLGDITIHNPVREPSGRSLRRTLQTLAYMTDR
jgi:hypothetical protein